MIDKVPHAMGSANHVLATCLGCGCVCDDVLLAIENGVISSVSPACPVADSWYSRGNLPSACRVDGQDTTDEAALDAAARLALASPRRLLIYVAGDVVCEACREAAALADRLGATIDGLAADTVASGILAAQRRGRATATLGELRHRADAVVFWGVDPTVRYPRFLERFVTHPQATLTGRTIVAVDVGDARGPAIADERYPLAVEDEVDAVRMLHASFKHPGFDAARSNLAAFAELGRTLAARFRYIAIVFDAEPGDVSRDPDLTESLIAAVQDLNEPARAALFALRGGGNRNGFESLLTWQTGFPFAVDFATGAPAYRAESSVTERLRRGRYDAVLVLGSPATVPPQVRAALTSIDTIVVGPGATDAAWAPRVAIDTGLAGLHENGLVLRMDDVPLHVVPPLKHCRSTTATLQQLAARIPQPVGRS